MIDFVTNSVNSRMITAFFDTRAEAESASQSLVALGVRAHQIQITDGASEQDASGAAHSTGMGFWDSLKSMFLPAEDHHSYAEGLQRGGYLLSAEVDPQLYDQAIEVVDSEHAVNMDERESNWRSSGWEAYRPEGSASGTSIGAAEGMASNPALTTPIPALSDSAVADADTSRRATRDLSHGKQRLRSYTLDAPVRDEAPLYREEPALGVFGISERFSPATDSSLIAEHMDVITSDGTKIGTVDHLDGDRIKLTKSGSPDGQHHFISLVDIDHVDAHVHLSKSAAEARAVW